MRFRLTRGWAGIRILCQLHRLFFHRVFLAVEEISGAGWIPRLKLRNIIKPKRNTGITFLICISELPGEPSTPILTAIGTSHAEITWTTQNSGAGSLLSCIIKYKDNESRQPYQLVVNITSTTTDKTFSALLSGLHSYTLYSVWVQAESTIGRGPPSTRVNFTTHSKILKYKNIEIEVL